MPVYLSTATVGNDETLLTLGHAGEVMAWFYPHKDHAQHIYQCLPAVYIGAPFHGRLSWLWSDEWRREQTYVGDTNIVQTTLTADSLGAQIVLTDVVPQGDSILLRQIEVRSIGTTRLVAGIFHYGDWNMGGIRMGNALRFDHARHMLVQSHRETSLALAGSALETWQCGKAGEGWGSNAQRDLDDGHLNQQDLEIGDVNWSCGFRVDLHQGESATKLQVFALAPRSDAALDLAERYAQSTFDEHLAARKAHDAKWLQTGIDTLQNTSGGKQLPEVLSTAYKRSLLCLPLINGPEGAAVAAPEFDPEFVSCGGYGYFWPRDGGEYVSGLLDAGYADFAAPMFDWCARHQDPSGLWHQRYFLNGEPGPNWCLPPDMLQIDQVGAVLWAYGKWQSTLAQPGDSGQVQPDKTAQVDSLKSQVKISTQQAGKISKAAAEKLRQSNAGASSSHHQMIRKAADYLVSRLTDKGVHGNAFDTWETFIGSFTYSNAANYAALLVAGQELKEPKYLEAAQRIKDGVKKYFVREENGYSYLVRGFDFHGESDNTVDSASLGAIEPFGLLDLNDDEDLRLAEGTLRAVRERLEVDWEGGRAIRRFEGDAYVGGVPACVNTLWMARCCLHVASRLRELNRTEEANRLRDDAQLYLTTVLRRATPTGLLPELMQGPTGQSYWAAPHGWAMSSFVSGVLKLAQQLD
jgi:GH15 family glucan-1,4-alpha-glucosidase